MRTSVAAAMRCCSATRAVYKSAPATNERVRTTMAKYRQQTAALAVSWVSIALENQAHAERPTAYPLLRLIEVRLATSELIEDVDQRQPTGTANSIAGLLARMAGGEDWAINVAIKG